ncbi:UvrD-helicase domain-containing protein [Tessaracoccus sp. OH4464_COT-324]|uniref:HelD family protein n=1 Tax=Tessaracoccus sp. OH4464_COT-324 TaxID=2491059 RepID=UPI000F639E7C|nr:UvrD-helicase domain-containing protein [Tessaracoccus sp. OH4464_COT-324]RRD47558.1 helicase [Tessaracoccus sp. OH4464_COT-324]
MTTSREALEQEIAIEQAHVDKVYANLDVATSSAKELARQGREIFVTDRADFLREENGTALFERDAFAFQAARRLAVLDAEHEGLVFGRIDLTDDEVRYIGRIGVRDDEYEPLVIDWRAPAAEPFYRATQISPMNVIRRRVLRCRDERVLGIEDDLLDPNAERQLPIFGEGALMAAVTRARGRQMRDIVSTIQAEQDEAIRAPYRGVTVIAGGPGTGKTVVALHRAAYLLYTNRARLERGGVLVVGPSNVFMNYIERVLPSLGEDSVTLKSIGSVATDVLGMTSERLDDSLAATCKGSWLMAKVLRRLVRLPLGELPRLRVSVKGEILSLSREELSAIRDAVLAAQRFNLARRQATNMVVEALVAKLPEDVEVDDANVPELIREQRQLSDFMDAWWPTLSAHTVLARLADPAVVREVAPELSDDERMALAKSYAWLTDLEVEELPRGWSVADVALLDELVGLLGPEPEEIDDPLAYLEAAGVEELVGLGDRFARTKMADPDDEPQRTFAHLLIDEAQDITPMQWRMLRRRGPQASWTIVGDPAQSSFPKPEETERALKEIIGRGAHRRFVLSTNYRSPSEVFDLAAKVIVRVHPDALLPKAVRSTGVEPRLIQVSADGLQIKLRDEVIAMAGQVTGTIGIIVAPSRLADMTRFVLSDPRLSAFESRLVVVTALQAKGLEYDGVAVVGPDEIVAEAPGAERVLYVALTRATQRMVAIDIDSARWRQFL